MGVISHGRLGNVACWLCGYVFAYQADEPEIYEEADGVR